MSEYSKLERLYYFVNMRMSAAKFNASNAKYYGESQKEVAYNHEVIAYNTILKELDMLLST